MFPSHDVQCRMSQGVLQNANEKPHRTLAKSGRDNTYRQAYPAA
jgi:hypothetical protein